MTPTLDLSPARIAFSVIAVALIILIPIVVAFVAVRRTGLSWRYVGYGALIFLLFQLLTRVPAVTALQVVLAPWLSASIARQVLWVVGLAFTAGLFEEVGRYVGYRWLMRNDEKTWPKGVLYGIGHGGFEAVVLVGGLSIIQLISLFALAATPLSAIPEAQRALVAHQIETINATPAWIALIGVWERICTLCVHVALSVVVLQVFRRRSLNWLWLAIVLHMIVDLTALLPLAGLGTVTTQLISEGLLTLFAAAALWITVALRDSPAPPAPAPAFGPGAPA